MDFVRIIRLPNIPQRGSLFTVTTTFRLADPETHALLDLVDLARYPIDRPGSPEWHGVVAHCTAELAADGFVSLPGFLCPDALAAASAEIALLAPKALMRDEYSSVYARTDSEQDLPEDDPRRIPLRRTLGQVTRDQIPPDAVVHRLYVCPGFKAFIAACVGETRVFEYADPLAGLIATVVPPGGGLSWHYDTNEYVVTVMTQQPESGGVFEFVPGLRSPGDENIDGLGQVLRGEADDRIERRVLAPGDLHLFLGRYSLHRVSEVAGTVERHVAVLSYANRPGVIGPVDRTRAVYGRVTEAHLIAEEFAAAAPDDLIF